LSRRVNRKYMNRESTRKRRVQKTLGLHYSRFYVIALCIDSRFRHKILENCSQAAPVEKVGLTSFSDLDRASSRARGRSARAGANRRRQSPHGQIRAWRRQVRSDASAARGKADGG